MKKKKKIIPKYENKYRLKIPEKTENEKKKRGGRGVREKKKK